LFSSAQTTTLGARVSSTPEVSCTRAAHISSSSSPKECLN
jgi:hypothetical protein